VLRLLDGDNFGVYKYDKENSNTSSSSHFCLLLGIAHNCVSVQGQESPGVLLTQRRCRLGQLWGHHSLHLPITLRSSSSAHPAPAASPLLQPHVTLGYPQHQVVQQVHIFDH